MNSKSFVLCEILIYTSQIDDKIVASSKASELEFRKRPNLLYLKYMDGARFIRALPLSSKEVRPFITPVDPKHPSDTTARQVVPRPPV